MHYLFKADDSAPGAQTRVDSAPADGDEIKFVVPRAWVADGVRRLGESSLDLHHGPAVSQAEIDTVPADLLKDLFEP
jgi:hypothetical protein